MYHGLVSRFAANNTIALASSTCTTKIRVQFVYDRREYVTMVDKRHGLAPSKIHINFVVWMMNQNLSQAPPNTKIISGPLVPKYGGQTEK